MRKILSFVGASLLLSLPLHVLGASPAVEGAISQVAGILPTNGNSFNYIAYTVFTRFRPLLAGVAVLVLVLYGFRMIIAQEDDILTKVRPLVTAVVSGLVMLYLIEPFINAFYGTSGEIFQGNMGTGSAIVHTEVEGLMNWVLTIVASLAVLILIYISMRAILKGGAEEGIGMIKKAVAAVAAGLILLVFRKVIGVGYAGNPSSPVALLTASIRVISYALTFLALAAVLVLIYTGINLIISLGDEEKWTAAKTQFLRVFAGFLIIIISLAIVNFVILPGF